MKINSKILNLPPFISTSWDHVASLHMKGTTLAIVLIHGETVHIPGLPTEILTSIFAAHAAHLEDVAMKEETQRPQPGGNLIMQALAGAEHTGEFPMRFGFSTLDGMGAALQHDPSQSNSPPLPDEVLGKIAAIAKIVSQGEEVQFPQPHQGCNCMHCQICRAINGDSRLVEVSDEPQVADEELQFKEWDIVQTGEKLYEVTHHVDKQEKYQVFLGEPVGCTCGKPGCEHILAVLKS